MEANIWQPRTIATFSADTKRATQRFVADEGQTIFVLTEFAYEVQTNTLAIYKNGMYLSKETDWVEDTNSSFKLLAAAKKNDVLEAVALVGITGQVTTLETDIILTNHQALRGYVGAEKSLFLRGGTSLNDGSEGFYQLTEQAAVGTYVDNGRDVIVPTGGDGTLAWLRVNKDFDQFTTLEDLQAAPSLQMDRVYTVREVNAGTMSGLVHYLTVPGGTSVADGLRYIDHPNTGYQLKQLLGAVYSQRQANGQSGEPVDISTLATTDEVNDLSNNLTNYVDAQRISIEEDAADDLSASILGQIQYTDSQINALAQGVSSMPDIAIDALEEYEAGDFIAEGGDEIKGAVISATFVEAIGVRIPKGGVIKLVVTTLITPPNVPAGAASIRVNSVEQAQSTLLPIPGFSYSYNLTVSKGDIVQIYLKENSGNYIAVTAKFQVANPYAISLITGARV